VSGTSRTRDHLAEETSINPTELHSLVLQNGKPVPIVRLIVATEPAQAHQLEQGYWQRRALPRRVTGLHLFIPTMKLQHLPKGDYTNLSPRQRCKINQPLQILPAADAWHHSMHQTVSRVVRNRKTCVISPWIRIRVRVRIILSNQSRFFMTLMGPVEPEVDQGRHSLI
jgi:hypothetical protein